MNSNGLFRMNVDRAVLRELGLNDDVENVMRILDPYVFDAREGMIGRALDIVEDGARPLGPQRLGVHPARGAELPTTVDEPPATFLTVYPLLVISITSGLGFALVGCSIVTMNWPLLLAAT